MFPTLLSLLACPRDGGAPLELVCDVTAPDGEILSGELICPACRNSYPIRDAIPDLCELGPESSDVLWKRAEIAARDLEADGSYDRQFTPYAQAVERQAILHHLAVQRAHRVLELGCGTGRLSLAVLERCGEFLGVDFSARFLQSLRPKLHGRPQAHLVRADISHLPLRRGLQFDRVLSAQVLEHLPSSESRRAFIANSRSILKDDGRFVVTTYNHGWAVRLSGAPKQGKHSNGIYYYRYSAEELQHELEHWYRVTEVCGIRNRLIPKWILLRSGKAGLLADALISHTKLSHVLGSLLLAVGSPRVYPSPGFAHE
jgi:SAM-dependent methyltransferase